MSGSINLFSQYTVCSTFANSIVVKCSKSMGWLVRKYYIKWYKTKCNTPQSSERHFKVGFMELLSTGVIEM
jgi:hypothetical protein